MPSNLAIIPPQLPSHLSCYQTLINEGVGKAVVQLDTTGFTNIIMQSSAPSATQRNYAWYNTNDDLVYRWDATVSAWVKRHPLAPGTSVKWFWTGSLAAIETLDGGESGTIGDAAGPMWQRDTDMDGKIAIAAGTLPSGAVLTIGDEGGEDKHTMTTSELVAHTHTVELDGGGNDGSTKVWTAQDDNAVALTYTTSSTGSTTPFNVLNPYLVGVWLERTARIYYRG